MKGIRALIEPQIDDTPIGAFVPNGKVALQMFGTAAKSLSTEGPQSARLVFLVGFKDKARDAPPDLRPFASYDGEIEVAEPRSPTFTFKSERPTFDDPPPSGSKLAREVLLLFDEASFIQAPDPKTDAARLRLPEAPPETSFAELGVQLEINGAVDSAESGNDRLDLIIKEFAEITLLDEDKVPMSGTNYKIMQGDFEVSSGVLDEDGFARVEGLPSQRCSVVFPDLGEASVRILPRDEVPPELL